MLNNIDICKFYFFNIDCGVVDDKASQIIKKGFNPIKWINANS